eukprot:g6690.t1
MTLPREKKTTAAVVTCDVMLEQNPASGNNVEESNLIRAADSTWLLLMSGLRSAFPWPKRFTARVEGGSRTGTGAGNQQKKGKDGGAGSAAASNDHGDGGGVGSGSKSRDEPGASGAGRDDDQRSDLLATTRSMEKQLKNQRRKWPKGHVRQILRCRQNLIARVIGTKGVTLNYVERRRSCRVRSIPVPVPGEETRARVDVLRNNKNKDGRLFRCITVRGTPKSVAHAVRLLCETVCNSVVAGGFEKRGAVSTAHQPVIRRGRGKGGGGNDVDDTAFPAAGSGKNEYGFGNHVAVFGGGADGADFSTSGGGGGGGIRLLDSRRRLALP